MKNTKRLHLIILTAAAIMLVGAPLAASADELAETARKVFTENQDSVVTIKLVMEYRFARTGSDSQTHENKSEITGTVIDPSGLTVTSLLRVDPTSASDAMGASEDFSMESELKSAKIMTADGDEIEAEIVLRDKDLDLAFLRPKEKSDKKFKAVDLSQSTTLLPLDPFVLISKLGKVANRAHGAIIDRVEAVVEKPRMFYVPAGSGMGQASLGVPAFTMDGKLAGFLVYRIIKTGRGGMMSPEGSSLMIIVPAKDVMKVAEQAKQENAPEKQ